MTVENQGNPAAKASGKTSGKSIHPGLKLLLELGPLVVFFVMNFKGEQIAELFPVLKSLGEPIFMATAAFMAAMALSLIVSFALTRTIPIMPLVTGVVVLIFGGLTLYLHNDTFIKMKPTIVNTLFGGILLIGLAFGKSFLAYVFESAFRLNAQGWRILTLRWAVFFLFLAVLNEIIWRNFSTDFWVTFKVWGTMPLTMAFMLFQMPLLKKYGLPDETAE